MIVAEPYTRDGQTLLRNIHHAETLPAGYVDTGLTAMPAGLDKPLWDGKRVVGTWRPTDLTTAVVKVIVNDDVEARKLLASHLAKEASDGR